MSFYGSIYYQLVDAFNRMWITNKGKEGVTFPEEDQLDEKFEYHSPGRQGVIGLNSGNRWISFSREPDNTFTIWHNSANGEDLVSEYGFQKINNMHYIVPDEEETALEAIERMIDVNNKIPGCRAAVPKIVDDVQIYEIYLYEITGWEKEAELTADDMTVLTPDDFFVTTKCSQIDEAGHTIPGGSHLYKMPKSDVSEQIDKIWNSIEKIVKIDEEQQELIDQHEEYVGDWSVNRGYTFEQFDEEGNPTSNHWVPTISMAIGDMIELITGEPGNQYNQNYWKNKDVNLVRVIGNLSELFTDLGKDENFGLTNESKLTEVNLIKVILYLKNKLIAANTAALEGHTETLTNLTRDVNRLDEENDTQDSKISALEEKDLVLDADIITLQGQATNLENRATTLESRATTLENKVDALEEEDIKIYQKITDEKEALAAEDSRIDGKIDALTITVNDHNTASLQTHNQLREDLTKQGEDLSKEIDSDIAAESAIINGRIDNEVNTINGKIDTINNTETGILKTANNYADSKIADLNYTDSAAADGQYVYSVNETNGIIAVEHKALPTYTLTSGSTNGTVAFNGSDVIVKGLGTAAYSNTDAFDASGAATTAKTEAIAEAKTETENQVKALAEGAVADNSAAIEALELLLQDYNTLVEKVAELEGRIAALEPAKEEPAPGEEGS